MYRKLTSKGVRVPNGFATTAKAYDYFMEGAGLKKEIKRILKGLNTHNVTDLMKRGSQVRKVILQAKFPEKLEKDIIEAYRQLSSKYRMKNADVAVRSSATAEDLPDASFAGQQETFLNIQGEKQVVAAVHRCIASLFTNRAISYRVDKGFDHFKIALSAGIQKMARSDKAASGVMFSIAAWAFSPLYRSMIPMAPRVGPLWPVIVHIILFVPGICLGSMNVPGDNTPLPKYIERFVPSGLIVQRLWIGIAGLSTYSHRL